MVLHLPELSHRAVNYATLIILSFLCSFSVLFLKNWNSEFTLSVAKFNIVCFNIFYGLVFVQIFPHLSSEQFLKQAWLPWVTRATVRSNIYFAASLFNRKSLRFLKKTLLPIPYPVQVFQLLKVFQMVRSSGRPLSDPPYKTNLERKSLLQRFQLVFKNSI